MKKLLLFVSVMLMVAPGCKKDKAEVTPKPVVVPVTPPLAKEKIIEVANFKIGAAVVANRIKNEDAYDNTLKGEFNQITAEYEMKMNVIWSSATGYNFEAADFLVDYAQKNKMEVHGHALLWYQSFPEWFKAAKYDSVVFESKVKDYITAVVGRYKGKIRSWDVANEIFNDDGTIRVEPLIQGTFKDPVGFVL